MFQHVLSKVFEALFILIICIKAEINKFDLLCSCQVFPLLTQHFSLEEQASLVWQFFCSIPLNMMAEFLPWLSSSISTNEYQDMRKCLSKIVPEEKLLQQARFEFVQRIKLFLNIFWWLHLADYITLFVEGCIHLDEKKK